MINSNPAVKDLADQITSSEKNKDVKKSLDNLKGSVDSLSDEIKKRGVKSINSSDDKKSDNLSLSEMLKGFTKGFFNPFTNTDKLVDNTLKARQEEIPADKLKTSDIDTKEDTTEEVTVEQKEEPTKEKKPKVEKKTKTKDPELNNKLLVSISQMLNELRENTIEKQLLAEAVKIRNILEKENVQISSSENISSNEQLMSLVPPTPDEQGRIEPYLEEEKQKNTIQHLSANDKNISAPPVHGEVIVPEKDNEEKKAKERELLAQAIADKLADLLGNIGGNTGLNIPDVPDTPDRKGSSGKSTKPKLSLPKGAGRAASILAVGSMIDYLIGEGIGALGLGTSESQHDEIVENLRKEHEESKKNNNSLDVLKNSGILDSEDIAPTPSPMSQENKKSQITPKESKTSGQVLQNVYREHEEYSVSGQLSGLNSLPPEARALFQQAVQPIISNQTTNNTSQTIMPAPPVPNQNTNSYLQWIKSRANY